MRKKVELSINKKLIGIFIKELVQFLKGVTLFGQLVIIDSILGNTENK